MLPITIEISPHEEKDGRLISPAHKELMGMPLDQRRSAILHQVLNTTSYVTCGELTEQLNISRRTLYYDIEKINGWLKETGLTPIKRRRSAGFYLEDQTKKC